MKKMISFILAAAMSAMVAVPAFAAAPEADTVRDGENAKTWTTSGKHDDFKDKMMTMIAYAPNENGEITVDSIQYIDQTTADASGAYSFDSYMLKVLPTAGDYTVKVGSEARDSAVDAGIIEQIKVTDVAISGEGSALGKAVISIEFYKAGESTSAYKTEVVGTSEFEVNVAPGTYDVVISSPGYLDYKITNVEVNDAMSLKPIKIKAGDVDGNGIVMVEDIGFVVSAFKKTSADAGYTLTRDFDANGAITVEDIGFVVANFKQVATTIDYADFNK